MKTLIIILAVGVAAIVAIIVGVIARGSRQRSRSSQLPRPADLGPGWWLLDGGSSHSNRGPHETDQSHHDSDGHNGGGHDGGGHGGGGDGGGGDGGGGGGGGD